VQSNTEEFHPTSPEGLSMVLISKCVICVSWLGTGEYTSHVSLAEKKVRVHVYVCITITLC